MDQQVQEAYLSAMGVSLWYPRFTLPNAPELDWPVDAIEQTPASEPSAVLQQAASLDTVQSQSSSSSLSQIKSLIGDEEETGTAPLPSDKSSKVEPSPSNSKPATATEVVPPFGFLFFRYALGVSVVVSVRDNEPLSSVELRFLEAVIGYLGVPTTPEFNHRVSWPLVKQSPQFSTREFFEDSMKALFNKQAVGFGVNTYLLFGQRLSQELSGLLKTLSSDDQSVQVVSSPELPELLTSADAKRALWKQLLPIKA
ncbi:hypothetical protein [Litoribrevibacter albus]|uniref:Uncharacterized protein n=1 Tax=Litoribrevibacter albus TaxID=1473156 RepID=A0AA37SEZ1_9GAMM|nr:hypothetical protein [Litoribrevibacter albus]GLQ33227.1 hypothetical protein GCM10007876_37070 [Litoribrevibacter albus]